MRVLMTGRGTSGSWQIRGEQLGAALGARVEPVAVGPRGADVVVAVKRLPDDLLRRLRGVPLVWDIVDAWPQPGGNEWGRTLCMRWLAQEIARIRPAAIVAATRAMADDLAVFDLPVLWLPHHHRPGIASNPVRSRIEVVGYEGSPGYIESWRPAIERECARIGARFVVNPPQLADVDVVFALRGSRGYAPRYWKSGVKLANAHGSGTPWIGVREAGYLEIASGAEYWADTPAELRIALDWLSDQSAREQVSDRFRARAYGVDAAAAALKEFVACVARS
jgi:hypothetical protein